MIVREHSFVWGKKTYLMGILNVTPDSFSDGGKFNSLNAAVAQAKKLVKGGADILDIGGQSTRPGAEEITEEEELNRVIPVIRSVRQELAIPISIDTTRARVAQEAIEAGADLVNDVSGGTFDPQMLSIVATLGAPIILMHIRGTPTTMQSLTDYQDLVGEIYSFLQVQINKAVSLGVDRGSIIIDPGIGFAKTYQQNLRLIKRLGEFRSLAVPILVGVSRKSFIGQILQRSEPMERVWGSAAACCAAISNGADILRVHDLPEMYDVSRVADVLWRG
jgi:dihydropteroate synthase